MQTLDQLAEGFAIPGVLAFDRFPEGDGLIRARVTMPACTAELFLQGAHLGAWQPAGEQPVLFLSERSFFQPGKAIRGGVPIIFPWFGPRTATAQSGRADGPNHGFARTESWRLDFAGITGDDLHLALSLTPNELTRSLGFDRFRLAYQVTLGRELRLRLTVMNDGDEPLTIGEAFHTYLHVGDVEQVRVQGLGETEYLDKPDGFRRKRQTEDVLIPRGETDRMYLNTTAAVTVEDPVLRRRITVAKANSRTTVVWNPWAELAATLKDMAADGWRRMLCVETANAAENVLTLRPQEAHAMEAVVSVEALRG